MHKTRDLSIGIKTGRVVIAPIDAMKAAGARKNNSSSRVLGIVEKDCIEHGPKTGQVIQDRVTQHT
jgi:hypothetical protein